MNDELFDKGKEALQSMSREQLLKLKLKIEKDLQLESGVYPDAIFQKSYCPMPWMVPNMKRAIEVIEHLLIDSK